MVVSSAMLKYHKALKEELLSFILQTKGAEIVEHYEDDSVGLYFEANSTKDLINISENITKQRFTRSFDLAYFNSELEKK